jgi:hypothetical protein
VVFRFRNTSDFVVEISCREIDIFKFAVNRSDPNVYLVNSSYSMISSSSVVLDVLGVVEPKETPFVWVGGWAAIIVAS